MELDDYLPVLEKTKARFANAAAAAVLTQGWQAHVPGCPGWRLRDLVWHLSEGQHFWAWVVKTRAPDPSRYVEPARRPHDEAHPHRRRAERDGGVARGRRVARGHGPRCPHRRGVPAPVRCISTCQPSANDPSDSPRRCGRARPAASSRRPGSRCRRRGARAAGPTQDRTFPTERHVEKGVRPASAPRETGLRPISMPRHRSHTHARGDQARTTAPRRMRVLSIRRAARAGRATRRWARDAGRCAAARRPAAGCTAPRGG